jgi:hypothetical protein
MRHFKYPVIRLEILRKTAKHLSQIAGNPIEIRSEHLSSTNVEHYQYINLDGEKIAK